MTNVSLKHFADTIYNPTRTSLLISLVYIYETFNSSHYIKITSFFCLDCQLSVKYVDIIEVVDIVDIVKVKTYFVESHDVKLEYIWSISLMSQVLLF